MTCTIFGRGIAAVFFLNDQLILSDTDEDLVPSFAVGMSSDKAVLTTFSLENEIHSSSGRFSKLRMVENRNLPLHLLDSVVHLKIGLGIWLALLTVCICDAEHEEDE